MHHPTDRIAHTTAFVTPVVEHWLEREKYVSALFVSWSSRVRSLVSISLGYSSYRYVMEWNVVFWMGNRIYVSIYYHVSDTHSRTQPLAWPVTLPMSIFCHHHNIYGIWLIKLTQCQFHPILRSKRMLKQYNQVLRSKHALIKYQNVLRQYNPILRSKHELRPALMRADSLDWLCLSGSRDGDESRFT